MLTRASCAKAVVAANAANRAAIKVMRRRYPNCFIVTLLVVERIKYIPTVFCGPHLVCSRLKALITNDSWIGLALQPINFTYSRDLQLTLVKSWRYRENVV